MPDAGRPQATSSQGGGDQPYPQRQSRRAGAITYSSLPLRIGPA